MYHTCMTCVTDPKCVLPKSKSVSLECWVEVSKSEAPATDPLLEPVHFVKGVPFPPFKWSLGSHGFVFWKSVSHCLVWWEFFCWILRDHLFSAFPSLPAPRNQCPHEAPWRDKSPGWPTVANCSKFQRSCLLWHLSIVLCFVLSRVHPPTTFKCFFFLGSLFFFVFSFSAACHRNDTHTAESALDSFLQTRTTNSPVREQSERKMKNNIRKEPFGKLHKKCYIKIDTGAWPFVVLYILKPSIDSLLITCLF